VTAATYTAATITVAADGRITSASSGSGGAGGFVPTRTTQGPSSGTHTAAPTANRLAVYMYAGDGNSGANMYQPMCSGPSGGGSGGTGGYGFYNAPIVQPFSQPFSVGGAAQATNLANVGTVNQGNSGNNAFIVPGNPGNPGNAPGATLVPTPKGFVTTWTAGSGYLAIFENTGT
jgi:hypothetical protein